VTTDVDICNRALGAMGTRSTIASLQEASAEAAACQLRYNDLRDQMLRAANWGFALGTAQLGLLRAAPGTPENSSGTQTTWTPALPSPPWLYSYAYPTDCIRFRGVKAPALYSTAGTVPLSPVQTYIQPPFGAPGDGMWRWQQAIEQNANGNPQRVINTNVSQALGGYTRQITLPDLWDVGFRQALIYALAAELSIPLSGDKGLRDRNVQGVKEALTAARVVDANEGEATQDRMPDWIRIRGGNAGYLGDTLTDWLNGGWDGIAIVGTDI
jgi:hypothetical protein